MSGSPDDQSLRGKAILTDATKCIGCERCVQACVEQNHLPLDIPAHYKGGDGLSSARYCSIEEAPGATEETLRYVRRQCMHCLEPGCAAACLVGALKRRDDGPVVYDPDLCIGCRYCMLGCPFSIPRYEYDQQLPYIKKCKMDETCRVDGGGPACTSACPTGATVFGPREELITQARRRIAAQPDVYLDHVWGEHEFGGTSVVYISDTQLGSLLDIPSAEEFKRRAVSNLATGSLPDMLHGWVMVTPFQFLGGLAALGGLAFFRRRNRVREEEAAEKRAHGGEG